MSKPLFTPEEIKSPMKVDELAAMMGISRSEVEAMLKGQDTITLDLKDSCKQEREFGEIRII